MFRKQVCGRAVILALGLVLKAVGWPASAAEDRIVLVLDQEPTDGLVMARVDLTAAARWCGAEVDPGRLRAFTVPSGQPLPAQFVPDEGSVTAGTIVLRTDPAQRLARVRLDFLAAARQEAPASTTVRAGGYTVTHDPRRLGGLPAEIVFGRDGVPFGTFSWNDRLYHRQAGQYWLRHDRQPRVQCVSAGPLCTVVRVRARYAQPDGRQPESQPEAVYDWFYVADRPLVFVRGTVRQQRRQTWHEAHFLELSFPTNGFSRWAGGAPPEAGAFCGNDQSRRFSRWGAVLEGRNGIGIFDAGTVILYDGVGFGRYLLAHGDAAWQEWSTTQFEREAWLWVGSADQPAEALARLGTAAPIRAQATVSTERLEQRLETLQAQQANAEPPARREAGWELALTRLLQKQGRLREALESVPVRLPSGWVVLSAGEMRLIVERGSDGLALRDLVDAGTGVSLLAGGRGMIFEATLRHAQSGETRQVDSGGGWGEVTIGEEAGGGAWGMRWVKPQAETLGGLVVTARVRADAARHRLAWRLAAEGQASPWSLWRVRFPQLTLAAEGSGAELLLPQAAGVVKPVGREHLGRFHGQYPSGWMAMQVAALYDRPAGTGLYFGLHDPVGSTKDFVAETDGRRGAIRLVWDIPVPDMSRAGNRFELSGEAVWQRMRGDWFDAALIYRDWVRREAAWFPKPAAGGRSDTPLWMREVSAWAQTGGAPEACVPRVLEFAKALGVPVGFHWYDWHRIPFDNDYPHYFPTKNGFAEGVKTLQAGGVHVMPYINGRLWDTRDQGTNDAGFTRLARPAATKDIGGEPCVETYGSKEADGQPVRLAVMCPATRLWRERQHDLVMRLFTECGVHGVYMDQIAAASPRLCFDAAHGHPLGGGSWWNEEGYWPMLDRIRAGKPADRMLTTECNAEPFVRWFDGYLTWHWQYDGQVPLFPAVYGGAIQMFGRAYRAGPTKDLALRMKAAQQLVWGEQLGWLDPGVVREPENFAFFRDAVRLRWELRRYFHAGHMTRPPRLDGAIPSVTADWQWSGVWPVTTPALMAGAWHLPAENRLVLLFANVGDQPVTATVTCDLREAGVAGDDLQRRQWTPQGASGQGRVSGVIREAVAFPARRVWAWEIGAWNTP
ncbi:MAG: hypothetical protein JXQ71_08865 [Verrucomicrobia bacterium]|nr:hypothetical protein [Verrucomicrobiota bacterium]